MPRNFDELAAMIARRDGISINEAYEAIEETQDILQEALVTGSINMAEEILASELGLELDYIDIFF